jgi:hypothetical protein
MGCSWREEELFWVLCNYSHLGQGKATTRRAMGDTQRVALPFAMPCGEWRNYMVSTRLS